MLSASDYSLYGYRVEVLKIVFEIRRIQQLACRAFSAAAERLVTKDRSRVVYR